MTETARLIERLAGDAAPVRRLPPPWRRSAAWLSCAAALLLIVALLHGVRPDLGERLRDPAFAGRIAAALLTGILAAHAAFVLSLPDRSRRWLLLPLPAALLWFAGIGYGCLTDWIAIGPDGLQPGEALSCFGTVVVTSLPPGLALLVMLRHAARLRPLATAISGSLAVAALAAAALFLLHSIDASVMVLAWSVGILGLAVALGGRLAPPALAFVAARLGPPERRRGARRPGTAN